MTKRSPWSNQIEEGALRLPRRHTLKSTEDPTLTLTVTLGFSDHHTGARCRSAMEWMIRNRRTG